MPVFLRRTLALISQNSGTALGGAMVFGVLIGLFYIVNQGFGASTGSVLFFAVMFVACAFFSFAGLTTFNLMDQISTAHRKLAAAGESEAGAYASIRANLAEDIGMIVILFVFAVIGFVLSSIHWNALDQSIFTAPASESDVALFAGDMVLKGALFDVLEHFKTGISPIELNYDNRGFVLYALAFRLYVSLIFLSSAVKIFILLSEIDTLKKNKAELTKFIASLPEGDE